MTDRKCTTLMLYRNKLCSAVIPRPFQLINHFYILHWLTEILITDALLLIWVNIILTLSEIIISNCDHQHNISCQHIQFSLFCSESNLKILRLCCQSRAKSVNYFRHVSELLTVACINGYSAHTEWILGEGIGLPSCSLLLCFWWRPWSDRQFWVTFPGFHCVYLCLLDPHQKSSCTEHRQLFPFDWYFTVTSGSDLWLSLRALISPKEKTILREQNKSLLDVRNQYSLLQVEIIVWGSLISNRCRTQTTAPAHSRRSSHSLIVSLDAT